jgi:hypothetical protein
MRPGGRGERINENGGGEEKMGRGKRQWSKFISRGG